MAALSMVTIAALIDAPGLGKTVLQALQPLDVGTAFNAGLAIVVMAIVLDRVTTAASVPGRARATARAARPRHRPRGSLLAVGGVVTAVCVYLSLHLSLGGAVPRRRPRTSAAPSRALRTPPPTGSQDTCRRLTDALKDVVTYGLLNPFAGAAHRLAVVAGRRRAARALARRWPAAARCVTAAVCLGLLVATGLWSGRHDHAGRRPSSPPCS